MTRRTLFPGAALAAMIALFLPAPRAAETKDAPVLHMVPKAREMTSFEFEGRLEITNKDVSFDAPPEYHDSFAFWTDRLKGVFKYELVQFLTITREKAEDGTVPFHKQIPRYYLEITRPGQLPATGSRMLFNDVKSLKYDGVLDPYGNVKEIMQTGGDENEDFKNLGYRILNHLFPRLDGPRDLKVGESFEVVTGADLPSNLSISGLENIGLLITRTYTLREVKDGKASFDIRSSLKRDPSRPVERERTTCTITGEGSGQASFDVRRGVFESSMLSTTMAIVIEAPLRHLPEQPEGYDPGLGKTSIEQRLLLQGKQHITRLFGTDTD